MQRPQKIFELEVHKVERLGDEIGYGNLMSLASALWSVKQMENYGTTQGVFIPVVSENVIFKYPLIDQERLETINRVKDVLNPTKFLVLDKTNKVVKECRTEQEAKDYVLARPYLKYQEL